MGAVRSSSCGRGELKTRLFRLPARLREQARYRKALERPAYTTTSRRGNPPERHRSSSSSTAAEAAPPRADASAGCRIAFLAGMAPLT